MPDLNTQHWAHLQDKPAVRATFKQHLADFEVREQLGYEPCGDGEHIYLWVEKHNLNTAFLAEQLAKFSGLPLRNVTYAGRKDKHSISFQWFALHCPGKQEFDWPNFELAGATVHRAKRHNKKLRVGQLKGNQFKILLRNLSDVEGIEQRLQQIRQQGVPNYFGQQRFGDSRHHPQGGNLALAEKMLAGEAIRNRNKRNLAISALRSWLFNQFIHHRLISGHYLAPFSGEVFCLRGSNSFFSQAHIDKTILSRLQQQDIHPSAPLWGKGQLVSQADALSFEQNIAARYPQVCQLLENLGLKQERRPLRLFAQDLCWKIDGNHLHLEFFLPSGCFATSVLRELVILESA